MNLQLAPAPIVDSATCAVGVSASDGCRACVERCPYDAIDLQSRPDGYEIRIDPMACQRCGACSGVCPTSAIERPFLPDSELVAHLVAAARASDGPVVGVTCPESLPQVIAALGAEHVVVTSSLLVINETHLAAAVAAGARGVLLVGCARCTHLQPELLQEPLAVARAMFDEPRRVAYVEDDRTGRLETALCVATELPVPIYGLDGDARDRLLGATTRRARLAELLAVFGPGGTVPMVASGFGRVELNQDACVACGACAVSCPTGALVLDPTVAILAVTDLNCIGCGACASACPDDAITVQAAVPVGSGALRPRTLLTDDAVACARCGDRYAAQRLLDHARSVVEAAGLDPSDSRLQLGVCPTCRNPEGGRPRDDRSGTTFSDGGMDSSSPLPDSSDDTGLSRRSFLRGAVTTVAAGAVFPLFGATPASATEQEPVIRPGRMGMVIDLDRCIGCHACTNVCKAENNVPLGKYRDWVEEHVLGEYPNARPFFLPKLCNHCDDPGCLRACPTGAIFKRADGIVDLNPDICIACQACMQGCPYGMTFYNHQRGTADKCNLCSHRIDEGLDPACVEVCPSQCRIVGDFDDPESPVSQYLALRNSNALREDYGLGPNVQYVGLPGELDR